MSLRRYIFGNNAGIGKKLLTTKSNSANWQIMLSKPNKEISYTMVDDVTGNIIKTGAVQAGENISDSFDLTSNSDTCSLYLTVDDLGSGITYIKLNYANADLVFLDAMTILSLEYIQLTNGLTHTLDVNINQHPNLKKLYPLNNITFTNANIVNESVNLLWFYIIGTITFNNQMIELSRFSNTLQYLLLNQNNNISIDITDFSGFNSLAIFGMRNINIISGTENVYIINNNIEVIKLLAHNSRVSNLEVYNFPNLRELQLVDINNSVNYDFTDILTRTPKLELFVMNGAVNKIGTDLTFNNLAYLWYINISDIYGYSSINVTNCPLLKWYYSIKNDFNSLNINNISQQNLEKVYVSYSNYGNIDLSDAVKLWYINFNFTIANKINVKNGNNANLTAGIHTEYTDACIIVDDINLSVWQNFQKRAGDLITTNPLDPNCP